MDIRQDLPRHVDIYSLCDLFSCSVIAMLKGPFPGDGAMAPKKE